MSQDLALYLRLAPEFGGTRFGPFEGSEVRLGSDPEKNDITLPESLGVIAAHVKVLRQADDNLIVAPIERTAAVYVWTGGAPRPRQITTPVAVRHGDSLALVTAQGPRFIIELDELPEEIKKEREAARAKRRGRLSAGAFKQEGKRQVWMRLLTTGPGQLAQRAYTFVVSGAIFMPRNIFMMIGIGGGYVFGFVQTCRTGSVKDQLSFAEVELGECEDRVEAAESLGDTEAQEYTFSQLAQKITGVAPLGAALKKDKVLLAETKKRALVIFGREADYAWITNPKSGRKQAGNFATIREKLLADDDLAPETARLLLWTAAVPKAPSLKGFSVLVDSEDEQVCGRGPMAMTWRQANNLGIGAQLDALVKGDPEPYQESREMREELLKETAMMGGMTEWALEDDVEAGFASVSQGNSVCMYIEGTDKRDSVSSLVNSLGRELGVDGEFLPRPEENHHSIAAISKFYAADLAEVDMRERGTTFTLEKSVPSVMLDPYAKGPWVLTQTADTLAKAIVLPCVAVLKYGENSEVKNTLGEELPNPIDCLVLDWKLRNDEG